MLKLTVFIITLIYLCETLFVITLFVNQRWAPVKPKKNAGAQRGTSAKQSESTKGERKSANLRFFLTLPYNTESPVPEPNAARKSCTSIPFLAFLESSLGSPVLAVLAVLTWRSWLSLFGLSCLSRPVPTVLSRLSSPDCPLPSVLSRLSSPDCPLRTVLL